MTIEYTQHDHPTSTKFKQNHYLRSYNTHHGISPLFLPLNDNVLRIPFTLAPVIRLVKLLRSWLRMVFGVSLSLSVLSVDNRDGSSSASKDMDEERDIPPGCATLAGIGVGAVSILMGGMNVGGLFTAGALSSIVVCVSGFVEVDLARRRGVRGLIVASSSAKFFWNTSISHSLLREYIRPKTNEKVSSPY